MLSSSITQGPEIKNNSLLPHAISPTFAIFAVKQLKKMSTPINGDKELIKQVATVCSNDDTEIGQLIADAFEKIGDDGVIDLEEAKGISTTIEISDGMKFGLGWNSQYFVTNKAKAECVLDEPYILIYDKPLSKLIDNEGGTGLMPILEKVLTKQQLSGTKKPLMIF